MSGTNNRKGTVYKWHVIGNFCRDNNLSAHNVPWPEDRMQALLDLNPCYPSGAPLEQGKLTAGLKKYIADSRTHTQGLTVLRVNGDGSAVWHPDAPELQEPPSEREAAQSIALAPWRKPMPPVIAPLATVTATPAPPMPDSAVSTPLHAIPSVSSPSSATSGDLVDEIVTPASGHITQRSRLSLPPVDRRQSSPPQLQRLGHTVPDARRSGRRGSADHSATPGAWGSSGRHNLETEKKPRRDLASRHYDSLRGERHNINAGSLQTQEQSETSNSHVKRVSDEHQTDPRFNAGESQEWPRLYQEKEAELQEKEAELQEKEAQLRANNDRIATLCTENLATLEGKDRRLQECQRELDAIRNENERLLKQHESDHQAKQIQHEAELRAKDTALQQCQDQLRGSNDSNDRLRSKHEKELRAKEAKHQKLLSELHDQYEADAEVNYTKQLAGKQEEFMQLLKAKEDEVHHLHSCHESKHAEHQNQLEAQYREIANLCAQHKSELQTKDTEKQQLQTALTHLHSHRDTLSSEIDYALTSISDLRSQLHQQALQLTDMQCSLDERVFDIDELKEEVRQRDQQIQRLATERQGHLRDILDLRTVNRDQEEVLTEHGLH